MSDKRTETITNLGNMDKLTVQKSLPLFALWRSELTLAEFKILDTYLARINSHNPDKRTVVFEKGELEKVLGVQKLNNNDLITRLKHLMGNVVQLPDKDSKNGFKLITLFEEAEAEQDDTGLWQVKLECTQKAMKYFFNIENLGYLRYKLRCVTPLTSRYTYIMFIYLEANRFRKTWKVNLDDLKDILNCKQETYKSFKRFNDLVLKKIHKEMHEKTECRYSYETLKKGRSVVAIQFTVQTLNSIEIFDDEKQDLSKIEETEVQTYRELWEEAVNEFNFTKEQIDELREILVCIPDYKLPDTEICHDNVSLQRYHHMKIKVAEINRRNNIKKIKNKFTYLVKMLKQDADIE